MRSRTVVAFCTLMGGLTLLACSGKVAGVPNDGDPSSPAPGTSTTGAPGYPGIDPSVPTASPTSTPGSPGAKCFSADLGLLCRDAPEKAKVQALAICEGAGATLTGFYGDSSGRCAATCCYATDLPIPPDPGNPPDPKPDPGTPPVPTTVPPTPPACTYAGFGDGTSCIPYGDVGSIAQAACSATGRSVSSVHLGGTCAGGVLFGKVECCGDPAFPDAPVPTPF